MKRQEYRTLVKERCRVTEALGRVAVNAQRMDALPGQGVPQQFFDCAIQMPEVEKCTATRRGPGTIRDPLEAAQSDDDASDELGDESGSDEHPAGDD